YRRYGMYVVEGQPLDGLVEVTLKDDRRHDPPINEDALVMLGLLAPGEYGILKGLTRRAAAVVKEVLAGKGIELYDIKFEFGKVGTAGEIVLIDEISGGNMRAYKNGAYLEPLTLEKLVLDN